MAIIPKKVNGSLGNIESILKDDGFFVYSGNEPVSQMELESKVGLKSEEPELFRNIRSKISGPSKDVIELYKEETESEHKVITEDFSALDSKKQAKQPLLKEEYDVPTIISYLRWHMDYISKNVVGREEIIKQLMYAILTREHMLLLSRTGMAKSYMANHVFNIFDNIRIFSSQASKDQTPDNYFGPYNIEEFKKGKIRHNIHGSIIEANLVLLDEFFDANDVVLRSLLSVLNERKFVNGPEQIDVAIHTAIATANYMRINEVTEAVLDRFMYKSIIPEDTDMYNQLLIDHAYSITKGKPQDPRDKVQFNEMLYVSDIVRNNNKKISVVIPESVFVVKNAVINRFVSEIRKSDSNFFISPRKQAKSLDFLRASAILEGRYEVTFDDIKNMYFTICTLNSYIHAKQKDVSEKDVFLKVYEQTMSHFSVTGSFDQIEFLVSLRRLFEELREDPKKRERLREAKGMLQGMKSFLRKIFPGRAKDDDEEVTIESLKKSLNELNPSVEEVRELKQGMQRDYRDIY